MNDAISSYAWLPPAPQERFKGLQWIPEAEANETQARLLRSHLAYAAGHSPYYRQASASAEWSGINTVEDLSRLPVTRKEDLSRQAAEFMACGPGDVADICLTSATTSDAPTAVAQTASDLARLAYNEAEAFLMAGVVPGDKILVCAALDRCFMAGLAYFLGAVKLGATAIRAGSSSPAQLWQAARLLRATVLVGVPSLMRRAAEDAMQNGENPATWGVRLMLGIGEASRDEALKLFPAGEKAEMLWGAPLASTYASTEMATAFCECPARQGGHLRPELAVVEITDPAGKPVPAGQTGEVVVTPLGVTGMPLVRFATGDIARLILEPCSCGRQTRRLSPVLGRKSQMLKYKGTTVYPGQLLGALDGIEGLQGGWVEASLDAEGLDHVTVYVARREGGPGQKEVAETLRARARVVPEIVFVSQQDVESKVNVPGKRKKVTFFDRRQGGA